MTDTDDQRVAAACAAVDATAPGTPERIAALSDLYAAMTARADAGACYWCGDTVRSDGVCQSCVTYCLSCDAELTGAAWGPRGVCLHCHELSLTWVS